LADLARGFHDPWIAAGPIVAAPRDQAHAIAVARQAEAITVVLYFVKLIRAVRDSGTLGRQAKLE
jgi:hypothetical protein